MRDFEYVEIKFVAQAKKKSIHDSHATIIASRELGAWFTIDKEVLLDDMKKDAFDVMWNQMRDQCYEALRKELKIE